MPELPEVEITKKTLQKYVRDQFIADIDIRNFNLRYKIKRNFRKNLLNKKILRISRRSKYLIFHLSDSSYFIIHLGMSGRLLITKKKKNKYLDASFHSSSSPIIKHNHVYFFFKNNTLIYNDIRRFGFIKYYSNKDFLKCSHLLKLGVEPLTKNFNISYFEKKIKNLNKSIKNTLMDQSFISGLGNIYVNEALFSSKIHPERISSKVSIKEIRNLISSIKLILIKSIKFGGSTLKDFHNSEGKIGRFQNEFKIYGRENKKCTRSRCGGYIKKITIGSRASFFCSVCQKS